MKDLLPIGSVVTLQGTAKKVMIIGILQMQPETGKLYDYLGVPYPEGFISAKKNLVFNHELINDVVFTGYDNPERQGFLKLMAVVYEKAMAEKKAAGGDASGEAAPGQQ